ncbi:MAG: hypothetical protein ISS79_00135 [Phycisphaerae bacterium]|nr:hypothetical protein [Phycisphaerae bacterium]
MKLTDQIKECKAKIVDLEFNLAVERAVLERLVAIGNGEKNATPDKARPIIAHSIVPHIRAALLAKGKAMKVTQLLRAMQQKGVQIEGKTSPKRLISSALTRRKDLFKRVDRGLYDLKSRRPGLLDDLIDASE